MSIPDTKEDLAKFLIKANEQSDWLWRFYFKYMIVAGINTSMMFVLSIVLHCWIMGNEFNTKFLFHAFKLVFVTFIRLFFPSKCRRYIYDFTLLAFHGIKKLISDTLASFASALAMACCFCWATDYFWCCSFRCAFIMWHFPKDFDIQCRGWINWIGWIKIVESTTRFFVI